jgi:hypothetical protein
MPLLRLQLLSKADIDSNLQALSPKPATSMAMARRLRRIVISPLK